MTETSHLTPFVTRGAATSGEGEGRSRSDPTRSEDSFSDAELLRGRHPQSGQA